MRQQEPSARGGTGSPTWAGGSRPAGKGSEAIADPDVNGGQHPGWCSGFWPLQLGGSGTDSWPRQEKKKSFGRKDDVLRFGPAEFEAPGEMSGGQRNADLRGRREVQVTKMWESSAQRWQVKIWEHTWEGSREQTSSNTTCQGERMLCL